MLTWRGTQPYFNQRLPEASTAIMPPTVVTAMVAGSGPKRRPRGRNWALSRSWTMPGCARTARVEADDAAEKLGEIQHQPGAERFAGHAAAGTTGMDGDVLLGGIVQAGRHVGRTSGGGPPPAA